MNTNPNKIFFGGGGGGGGVMQAVMQNCLPTSNYLVPGYTCDVLVTPLAERAGAACSGG